MTFADSLVIGGGPAGILTIASCLEYLPLDHCILWADPVFNCGYLSMLDNVPRYKYIKQSLNHFESIKPLVFKKGSKLKRLIDGLHKNEFYHLCQYKEIFLELQNELLVTFSSRISTKEGLVSMLEYNTNDDLWKAKIGDGDDIFCKNVFIANGSHPKPDIRGFTPPCPSIPLEIPLNEGSVLNEFVTSSDIVAVVGSSHSAALSLRNLYSLPIKPLQVIHIRNRPFLIAIEIPEKDIIINDNPGLKGKVAEWVSEFYDTLSLSPPMKIIDYDEATFDAAFFKKNNITKCIIATGYERNPLPKMYINGTELNQTAVFPECHTGNLNSGSVGIPRIYGFGIAFPQKICTNEGSTEFNIGIWKFAKQLKEAFKHISYV